MSQSQNLIQQLTEEDRVQSHREAQQRYYYRRKGQCEFYDQEFQRLNYQVSYLNGQLIEKENSKVQLQSQLNERNNTINQIQQQLNERNVAITQLQTLLSRCDNQEENRRNQELVQTLTNQIQREQTCLQIINQLNSENGQLKIFRDLLIELNDKYPKILPSFIFEVLQTGNQLSSADLKKWAREQLFNISQNDYRPLAGFR